MLKQRQDSVVLCCLTRAGQYTLLIDNESIDQSPEMQEVEHGYQESHPAGEHCTVVKSTGLK